MCFPIFMNEKKSFQTTKKEVQKTEKFRVFLKRLGHGFGQNTGHFNIFSFRNSRPGKCVLRYSRPKKTPL